MTSSLELGSREHALALLDQGIGSKSRAWIEADGEVFLTDVDHEHLEIRQAQLAGRAVAPDIEPALLIPPLGYMLDYSGARPDLTVAKKSGAKVIARYISAPVASTAWKRIGKIERDSILKIIGDLWLNWEWYAGRMLEGAKAGAEDGKWALAAAEALSYPRGRIIPASHDTGANNDAAVGAYCDAFNKALGGVYKMTIYGGIHTVTTFSGKHGVQPVPWQTLAWSNKQVAPVAAVLQNTKQWFNGTVDENVIRHTPFGTWNHVYPAPVVKPSKPAPQTFQGEDMFIRFVNAGPDNDEKAVYYVAGDHLLMLHGHAGTDDLDMGWIQPIVKGGDSRSAFFKLPIVAGTPDGRKGEKW